MASEDVVELRLPALSVGGTESVTRSSMTWTVSPGAKLEKGQLVARTRVYHQDFNVRWVDSRDDCQMLLYAPTDGTIVSIPREHGGWNAVAAVMGWDANRDLGAFFRPAEAERATCNGVLDTAIVYADRCHPSLEPRNGGILIPGAYRRIELWTRAPARPSIQLLAYGVCDLTAVLGGISGDYDRWAKRVSVPCLTTLNYDVLVAHSSYYLLQDLRFTDTDRQDICAEIVDLIQEYLSLAKENASSISLIFLTLLLDEVKKSVIRADLDGPKMRAATPANQADKFVFLGLNADAPIHLRSKKSDFLFAAHLWKFRAFDKTLTRLLRKRFKWMEPTTAGTLANVEALHERLSREGHRMLIGTYELPNRRTYDFSKKPLQSTPDYWWRETNLGVRKLARRRDLEVVDLDRVITDVGASAAKAMDPVNHHDDRINDALRTALAAAIDPDSRQRR